MLAAILVAAGLVGAVMIQARWWALGAPIAVLVAALWAVASAVEPRKSLLVPSIDEQENLLEIYASETHKIHQLKAREQSKRAFQMHCDLNKEGRDLKAAIVLLKVSITLTLLSVLFHVFI